MRYFEVRLEIGSEISYENYSHVDLVVTVLHLDFTHTQHTNPLWPISVRTFATNSADLDYFDESRRP